MELPIKITYDTLLTSSILPLIPAENIFLMSIPEEKRKASETPLLRLTELSERQGGHRSNLPGSIGFTFQVDIWEGSLQKIGEMKNELDKTLNDLGLTRTYSTIIEDEDLPDTFRLIARFEGSQQIKF